MLNLEWLVLKPGVVFYTLGVLTFMMGDNRLIVRLYLEVGQIKRNFVTFAPPSSRKGKQKQERTGK